MKNIIFGSMDTGGGKTSLMIGLAKASGKSFGYMKPLGDRLVYRKKRVWDYDAALMTNIFKLVQDPEDITLGFEHLKMTFKYDEEGARKRVLEMSEELATGKDILFVEGGKHIGYGVSFHLNTLSLASYLGGKLILVISGDENDILDNIVFIRKHLSLQGIRFGGVIINKVRNIDDFKEVYLPIIQKEDVNILGIIPFESDLTFFSMEYLAQYLFARVVTGEAWLNRRINNIFIGAASLDSVCADTQFQKGNKLVIASGDRTDLLLASFKDKCTSAVIATNNVLPPQNILAKADENKIPVLLVPSGAYETAKQIEALTPMIASNNTDEIDLMAKMVKTYVNMEAILEG